MKKKPSHVFFGTGRYSADEIKEHITGTLWTSDPYIAFSHANSSKEPLILRLPFSAFFEPREVDGVASGTYYVACNRASYTRLREYTLGQFKKTYRLGAEKRTREFTGNTRRESHAHA